MSNKPKTDMRQVRRALAALHEYVLRQPAPAGDAAAARDRFLSESAPFLDDAKAEG